ncbi:MAG: hypothetical protein WKH97_16490 [Casimicrobiaceae bacterium]
MQVPLIALAAAGLLFAVVSSSSAETAPPPLPTLTAEQSANLEQEMERYRQDVGARVALRQVTEAEAQRLVAWRRWQLARQVAGLAPPRVEVAPTFVETNPHYGRPYYYGRPYAYASPYHWEPRPYFWGAEPYYWGPRISFCAGGFGRRAFGSLCF